MGKPLMALEPWPGLSFGSIGQSRPKRRLVFVVWPLPPAFTVSSPGLNCITRERDLLAASFPRLGEVFIVTIIPTAMCSLFRNALS